MILIDNQQALDEICANLMHEEIIAIDSEFERRTTYFAKLCTLQIVSSNHRIVIDALAELDLQVFNQLLQNVPTLKIFHSPREDFEIFYNLFKELPKNCFDTQIAAKLCGMGASISYSDLCMQICGVVIDKKYQKANWMKRPIKPQMLEYAITDALHLESIYESLMNNIRGKNLSDTLEKQMVILVDAKNYKVDAQNIWRKVSFPNRSTAFVEKMQVIAAFREISASDANVPRRHFLSDEDLVKICNNLPTSESKLAHLNINCKYLGNQKYKNRLFDLCSGLKEII